MLNIWFEKCEQTRLPTIFKSQLGPFPMLARPSIANTISVCLGKGDTGLEYLLD